MAMESEACAHKLSGCPDGQIAEQTLRELKLGAEDVFVCLDSMLDDEAQMRLEIRGI